jgi:hypothetical protein
MPARSGDDGLAAFLHADDGGAVPLDQAVARRVIVHGADMAVHAELFKSAG